MRLLIGFLLMNLFKFFINKIILYWKYKDTGFY